MMVLSFFIVTAGTVQATDERDYNVRPDGSIVAPFGTTNNYGIWYDRDSVDQWQATYWGAVNGGTYNTGGIYDIAITYHAVNATTATMFATINGIQQGFYTAGWKNAQPDIYPAGLSFTGDMTDLQVFNSFLWNSARDTGTVDFNNITATQGLTSTNYGNATYVIPSDGIFVGDPASQYGGAWNLMNGDLVLTYRADFSDLSTRLIDPGTGLPYTWSGELFAMGLQKSGQDLVEPLGSGWLGNFMVNPNPSIGTQGLNEKFDLQFNPNPLPDNPVPIPAAIWLLGSGLLGLIGIRRRFRK